MSALALLVTCSFCLCLGLPWAGEAAAVAKNRLETALVSMSVLIVTLFAEGDPGALCGILLLAPLSGRMVAWFLTRSLGLGLLVLSICTCYWCLLVS